MNSTKYRSCLSELIAKLQEVQAEHGDLSVAINDRTEEAVSKISSITVYDTAEDFVKSVYTKDVNCIEDDIKEGYISKNSKVLEIRTCNYAGA